jgi:hypothetical protein
MLFSGYLKSCNILDPHRLFELTEHLAWQKFIIHCSIPIITMGDYTLEVNVSGQFVGQFNEQGQVLCVAFGVASGEDGEPEYNVVASSNGMSLCLVYLDAF